MKTGGVAFIVAAAEAMRGNYPEKCFHEKRKATTLNAKGKLARKKRNSTARASRKKNRRKKHATVN